MPVYKDEKRGTWYVSFYYVDWTGKKRRQLKRGFKLKKEATEYEYNFLAKETKNPNMLFKALCDLYFENRVHRVRKNTLETKEHIIRTKLSPYFDNKKINEITSSDIMLWQSEILKKDYKPTYLKTINNQLTALFNFAVRHYGLLNNPCLISGSIGKKQAGEMEFWTLEEFQKFIAVVRQPAYRLAYEIAFWTGVRIGELLALTPSDVLLIKSSKILRVTKRLAIIDGKIDIDDTKTEKGMRDLPIDDNLFNDFNNYVSRLYGIESNDLLFYMTKSALNTNLKRYAKLAEVKPIRFHDLRHSHASMLIDMNMPIVLVSKRLGHANVEVTLKTYGHLYPARNTQLVEEIQKIRQSGS